MDFIESGQAKRFGLYIRPLEYSSSLQGNTVDAVNNVMNKLFQMAHTFGPQEWAVISLVTVVIGYMCLKTMKVR